MNKLVSNSSFIKFELKTSSLTSEENTLNHSTK